MPVLVGIGIESSALERSDGSQWSNLNSACYSLHNSHDRARRFMINISTLTPHTRLSTLASRMSYYVQGWVISRISLLDALVEFVFIHVV
jgi:hypothetical protein